ncbi:Ankyrin repeats (3 copies) [compost metagenome]
MQAGASIDAVDAVGDSALMYAACFEKWAALEILRQHGADLQAANPQGRTPAHAVQTMPLHVPDDQGLLPLMAAAKAGHCTQIEFLQAEGAQIDAVDAADDCAATTCSAQYAPQAPEDAAAELVAMGACPEILGAGA